MHQSIDHLVHGTVTPQGNHHIVTIEGGLPRMNARGFAMFLAAALLAAGAAGGEAAPAASGAVVAVSGELKQWHKVTLTLDGVYARETDKDPNPFTDFRMTAVFSHESGAPPYAVPGFFAADGNAAETSAGAGNKWRAHFAPDRTGTWTYRI